MNMQESLNLFNLPYVVTSCADTGSCIMYRIEPTSASATLNRLNTRLPDIKASTGYDISVVLDGGVFLRQEKPEKPVYLYRKYGGYVVKHYNDMELPYMVGLTATECIVDDLTKAPHLLVAGTTGSGKSTFLHTLICDMLCNPHHLDYYFVDCKQVELSVYEDYSHIAYNAKQALNITRHILEQIKIRYDFMRVDRINDIKDLMKRDPRFKYILFVVDEVADLISDREYKKEIVSNLLRIAQIGRAAGVHMVLATQRPDHTIINGTLKGNIPTRIAFNCASRFDSMTILDRAGAEKLTGCGDGLFLRNGARDLTRFQATYISLDYIRREVL